MTGRRARRRWPGLVTWAVVTIAVVAAAAVTVGAVQDGAELRDQGHARAHAAVLDLAAVDEGRGRVADLEAALRAAQVARTVDDVATVEIITALDSLQTLQDRIALAQLELSRVTAVSEEQVGQLRILHACANALEHVRTLTRDGDTAGAASYLEAGKDSCEQAEAMTEGSIAAAHPFDFADPQVMSAGGSYYAFGTNGPAGTVQVLSSADLSDWDVRGSALSGVPSWATNGFTWGPAAIQTGSTYTLFYTVKHAFSGKQCITRATATNPAGPYQDTSTGPLICQLSQAGSIDPSPYYDETGNLYLTWKSEGETTGGGAAIWMAPMAPDGSKMTWFPKQILTVSQGWEGSTIEGPSMAKAGDSWVLLYSANSWSSSAYSTGYATCVGPSGPCNKPADNRVLRSDDAREGPGGAEFFRTTDGQLKVAYAAWDAGEVGIPNPRRLHLGTVSQTPLGLRIT
ncbi:MAG TPA: glycoside hydrolase family 43 protein [Iamia sp.]|nr:glycoside hydrolase family 43 protein [Iamia sp.]